MKAEIYPVITPEEFFNIIGAAGDLIARFQKDGLDYRLVLVAPDGEEPVAEIHVVMGGEYTSLYFRTCRTDAAM